MVEATKPAVFLRVSSAEELILLYNLRKSRENTSLKTKHDSRSRFVEF